MTHSNDSTSPDSATGFPGVRSWRIVYLLVIAIFAIYVVGLTALSRAFQ